MARQEDLEAGAKAYPPGDDSVIELTEIVTDRPDEAFRESDPEAAVDSVASGDGGENDIIELTEVADAAVLSAPDLKLSEKQIQSALEQVIQHLYAEKIEKLLYEVVEQTVTREIERIKSLLVDKAPDT